MDHVTAWIFDLDNTLYPPSARLFDQIERRMTAWMERALGISPDEAGALRRRYWASYGTTMNGLMQEHGIDPAAYLRDVHDISLSPLRPDPDLAAAIRALPGRRFIHTNGSRAHAERVVAARGLEGLFDAVFGIEDTGFRPKPQRAAFEAVLALASVDPARAAMFEDDPRNLVVPHDLGMACVLVGPQSAPGAHVHHHATDLAPFLAALGQRTGAGP